MDRVLRLRGNDGKLVGVPIIAPTVPLGRWSGTSAGSAPLDNIFDAALYSHYTIVGQFLPATNGANLLSVLRTATPSDVSGGLKAGGFYGRLDAAGSGGVSNQSNLVPSVSSTSGITSMQLHLQMRSGDHHSFFNRIVNASSVAGRYYGDYSGEFLDTTPRQGISFYFSSGNITGWYEVIGHKKQ